ncbi:Beta-1,2-xylosyltransferase 1 [Vanrija pseudolonga]|uniref:Beta-1,2-xylosyltransferase 1 n=1 Tax=Vanrija pseudolonga TaxID=143232 RepID=A0AAF0Y357_9TREE|nr:Beta-1,2-xylosyltransferase 1 [Vanrija pseudolonga]
MLALRRIRLRLSKSTVLLSAVLVTFFLVVYLSDSGRGTRHATAQAGKGSPKGAVDELDDYDDDSQRTFKWNIFKPDPIIAKGLTYSADGLVHGWDKIHAALVRSKAATSDKHPIRELMKDGRKRYDSMLKRQSKTLTQAVAEYKKRYGRQPPRGFDAWFQWCKKNNVKIIDDYDQINRDIEPWLALSPEEFKKRVNKIGEEPTHRYKIVLRPNGKSTLTGDREDYPRPNEQFKQLLPLVPYLPNDVTLWFSDHDMANWILPADYRQAALDAVAKGTYLTPKELQNLEDGDDHDSEGKQMGLLASCAEDSPARQLTNSAYEGLKEGKFDPVPRTETTFMFDPAGSMDYCNYPQLLKLHGAFTFPFRRGTQLRPLLHLSKLYQNGDMMITPLEAYWNHTSALGVGQTSDWSEKTIDKLFWRGSTTGDAYTQPKDGRPAFDWRLSHRPRLHFFANREDGETSVWVERDNQLLPEEWSNQQLNKKYFDIKLSGRPHQCDPDGTCDEMAKEIKFGSRVEPEEAIKYKYVLDVDGNGWSSRFHRLLASGSVVFKSTIYPEWMSDWLTPWVHYVPVQIDYSDVYDIMSFFVGPPDASGPGLNDDLAKEIAANAKKFTTELWRWEDMQAYMFRFILEYSRLASDDRDGYVYRG